MTIWLRTMLRCFGLLCGVFLAGSLINFGLFWVIAISLLVADTHYRTFKKEVNKNLVGILQGG